MIMESSSQAGSRRREKEDERKGGEDVVWTRPRMDGVVLMDDGLHAGFRYMA